MGKSERVRELLTGASELPPERRAAYLDAACGGDAALRAEVESLLESHDEAGRFLTSPTGEAPPISGRGSATVDAPLREGPGTRIGPYKLLQLIGEGGFGSVFMAEQEKPVSRRVALKIIKLGMDTRAVIARFEAERQALAMMDHPNIARVLDAGATGTGRPFFVMELVKGEVIVEYCDKNNLSIEDRLELFAQVCHAVQHAHTKGIIHRDIKPSNILVSTQDGRPHAKVIDFGIAKATASKLTDKTLFTEHKSLIGTPEYMSPEQAEGSMDIDTRTDVYSLGVVLYELLTGTTPFSSKELRSAAYAEIQRIIREIEPPKPSTRLSQNTDTIASVAAKRHTEPRRLGAVVRGELDWIVMKALEKDRSRRYETASGLALDVRRYLAGEAVLAAPPSTAYRMRKFVGRNKGPVIAASLVLAALVAAFGATSWGLIESNRARSIALERQLENEQRTAADSARLERNAEAVNGLLGQCEEALRGGDAAKAAVAIDAARKRSAEGGAEKDAARLARRSADLDLLVDLDAVDRIRWVRTGEHAGSQATAATQTREALEKFGADPETLSVESAVATANASAVRERIVAALDRLLLADHKDPVHALLRRLDDDPFRNEVRDAILAKDEARFVELAKRPAALVQPPAFAAFLGHTNAIDIDRRAELLQAAVLRRPTDLGLLITLSHRALEMRPIDANEALRWSQAAVAAAPRNAAPYNALGISLQEKGRSADAIACFRKTIELDPTLTMPYANLGDVLGQTGHFEEALVNLKKAIELDPDHFENYCILGQTLSRHGRAEEGLDSLQKAIELNPSHAHAYLSAGVALRNLGRLNEAIAYFEKTIELKPKNAVALSSMGCVLSQMGRHDEAIVSCRKAIEFDPKYAMAYYNLGNAYFNQGPFDAAIANYRKAIEYDPNYGEAHCNLAHALESQGSYEEALAEFKRGHELGSVRSDWKYPSANWVRGAKAKAALAAKLPAFLDGKYQPSDNAERLELAFICQNKKYNYAATGVFAAVLAADPKVGENFEACVRFNAACVAALSAAGTGEDAANLSDQERARLRKQALDWLRAELNAVARRLESSNPADRAIVPVAIRSFLRQEDLVSIRDPAALAKLPAEEQSAFTQLWADAAALLKKMEACSAVTGG